jgi:hypothetical protein
MQYISDKMAGKQASKILPGFMMAPTFGGYRTRQLPGKRIGAPLRLPAQPKNQSEERDRMSLTERIFDILRR